jgi:hypothetical protein
MKDLFEAAKRLGEEYDDDFTDDATESYLSAYAWPTLSRTLPEGTDWNEARQVLRDGFTEGLVMRHMHIMLAEHTARASKMESAFLQKVAEDQWVVKLIELTSVGELSFDQLDAPFKSREYAREALHHLKPEYVLLLMREDGELWG